MKKLLLLIPIILLVSFESMAQSDESLESKQYRSGYVSFAKVKKEKSAAAKSGKEAIIRELTGNSGDISFVKTALEVPSKRDIKIQQEKYQLYKNGIKLRGGEYLINIVNDTVSFIHGFFAPIGDEAFTHTAQAGVELALKHFNTSHGINDTTNESTGITEAVTQIYYYDNNTEKFRAAWQVQVTSKNKAYSENVFINVATGEFMGAENLICHINFPGTSQTQYSNARNIVTDASTAAGPFRLQESRNGVLIQTRNMNNMTDLSNVTEFNDNDNNWTLAEHGGDRAAFGAHWGAEMVYDYWVTVHNRNSINGSTTNPLNIESYVHWDVLNDPDDFNASWFQNSMRYGDGLFGSNPLTSLDICAHEFGHGIDQFTGDLAYERESGALDEGFADIWGASVEAWVDPTKNRWLIAEEVLGGLIRNMANPIAFGQPDTYLGINWVNQAGCSPALANDYCGVHTNSGVLNFWYFLLSQGGTGTNDIGNAYNVTGLGINTAEEIAYETKLLLNNSSADYLLARSVSIQATTNLFGVNSCEVKTVTDAWFAVGVGTGYNGTLGASLTGPSLVCTGGATFTLNNVPAGATVTWAATPTKMFALGTTSGSGTTATPAAKSSNTSSSGTITFTINTGCGNPVQISQAIWVGKPAGLETIALGLDSSPPYYVCKNTTYQFNAFDFTNIPGTTYAWHTYGNHTIISYNGTGNITANIQTGNSPNGTYISAQAQNACGSSAWTDVLLYEQTVGCSGGLFSIYPNPANNYLYIEVDKSEYESAAFEAYEIVLLDNTGTEKLRTTTSDKSKRIDTSVFKSGLYFLNVSYKGELLQRQIVISR